MYKNSLFFDKHLKFRPSEGACSQSYPICMTFDAVELLLSYTFVGYVV